MSNARNMPPTKAYPMDDEKAHLAVGHEPMRMPNEKPALRRAFRLELAAPDGFEPPNA